LKYKPSDSDSRFLQPDGGTGLVNVVDNFSWTLSPKNARVDVPYVELVEYQQTTGQLGASLLYYSRIAANAIDNGLDAAFAPTDPSEVYKYKYLAQPTGFTYRFPYFSTSKHNRTTNFSGEDGKSPFHSTIELGKTMLGFGKQSTNLFSKEVSMLGQLATVANLGIAAANTYFPGNVSFELPQKWSSTSENSISVKFHLFNTVSLDDIDSNRNLAYILTYQNSPSRRNFALNDPVVIYSLFIKDVVNFPACYMDSLTITNIGNTRVIKNQGISRIIPEAYEFNMTFKSLILPTRNIMSAMDKGSKVEAIADVRDLQTAIFNALGPSRNPDAFQPTPGVNERTGVNPNLS